MKLATVVVLCALMLGGCSNVRRVDGIPISTNPRGGGSSLDQAFAMAMLDQQWPGHAPMEGYAWTIPLYPNEQRDRNWVRTRPGYVDQAIVFKLTDGTEHALYIGCQFDPDSDDPALGACFLGPPDELKDQ